MKNNKEREKGVIKQNQEVISEQARAFSSLSKDVSEIKQIIVDEKKG